MIALTPPAPLLPPRPLPLLLPLLLLAVQATFIYWPVSPQPALSYKGANWAKVAPGCD